MLELDLILLKHPAEQGSGYTSGVSIRLSVAAIKIAALHPSALAILKMIASVGICSPRSIFPMCERSTPARLASVSWAIPCSVLDARPALPKPFADRQSAVLGTSGQERVRLGGRRA